MGLNMDNRVEQSNAQSNRWYADIQGMKEISLKLIDFTMPMISAGMTDLGGPGLVRQYMPGDRIDLDTIQLNFLVDKKFYNWWLLYGWMKQSLNAGETAYKNVTLNLLDNQGRQQGVRMTFVDAWPIMMAPLPLDAVGAVHDLVMGLTLKFNDIIMNYDEMLELYGDARAGESCPPEDCDC